MRKSDLNPMQPVKKLVVLVIFLCAGLSNYAQFNATFSLEFPEWWKLSSIPEQPLSFPESTLENNLATGFNRAGISWFTIAYKFYNNGEIYFGNDSNYLKNHFVRLILLSELYPENLNPTGLTLVLSTFDIVYYPSERGPNNYDVGPTAYSAGIDSLGHLKSPETRWGGISQTIPIANIFEDSRVNYIGFWLMDPFVYDTLDEGGKMLIHLGSVSEDVLKDGLNSRECNLPPDLNVINGVDTTVWGRITVGQTSNPANWYDHNSTQYQDIGFDGLTDIDERSFFSDYLNAIGDEFGTDSPAYLTAMADPSTDNYLFYLDESYNQVNAGITERYRKYNGMHGNTVYHDHHYYEYSDLRNPDIEDQNMNNFLDCEENYYQYTLHLDREHLDTGLNFIDKKITVIPANGDGTPVNWYRFHIPVRTTEKEEYGDINLVNSSAIRLIFKDFENTVYLRFAMLQLMEGDFREPVVNDPGTVLLYPNPVHDILNIIYRDGEIRSVKINDITGRLVFLENYPNGYFHQKIDVAHLNNGSYLITIETDTETFHQKFIKAG